MHEKHLVFSDLLKLSNISISDSNSINDKPMFPQCLCHWVCGRSVSDDYEIPRPMAASLVCKYLSHVTQGLTCHGATSYLLDAINGFLQPCHTRMLT